MAAPQTDALTGASLSLQRLAEKSLGTLASAAFAGLAALYAAFRWPLALALAGALGYALALAFFVRRRLRARGKRALERQRDVELYTLSSVPFPLLLALAGPPFEGALTVLFCLAFAGTCATSSPVVAVATWTFVALESALIQLGRPQASWVEGALTLSLLALCGALSVVALRHRARVTEQRCENEHRLELERVRDVARSYRLTSDRAAASAGAEAGGQDDALVRSSVEEIQESLRSALSLARVALDARNVLFLGLDETARLLHLRGAVGGESDLVPGPFNAGEGLFSAALGGESALELVGPRAVRSLPYLGSSREIGHVALLPIHDEGVPSGLIALDRERPEPLSRDELSILEETARLVRRTVNNERIFVKLDRAKVEQGKLYRAVERLNEARSEVDVIQAGVVSAREFAAFQFAAVTLLRPGGDHEICAVSGRGASELVGQTFRDARGLVGMVTENRHPLPYRGTLDAGVQVVFSPRLKAPEMASLLVLPLLVHREVLGTLVLGSDSKNAFGNAERLMLQVLARHVAVSLANARMVKRLEELATTDGLTGLLNKRALTEVARQKLLSAERFKKPLSVLVCDLDHFKAVNDTHGHDVGDRVIAGFAAVLKRAKRETDAVGRVGGEEFVVVCEQTDVAGATLLAERIRSELGATTFVTPSGGLTVTSSVGISTYPQVSGGFDQMFKAADEALYASKRAGRDRLTVWTTDLQSRAAV